MPGQFSDIIRVSTVVSPGAAQEDFGRLLLLTQDATVLDPTGSGSVRTYSTTTAANADFANVPNVINAVSAYFAQEGDQASIRVGRWSNTASFGSFFGTPNHSTLAVLQSITTGLINVDGENVSGLDFSSDSSLADVAATLQTDVRAVSALGSTYTVIYQTHNDRFVISNGQNNTAVAVTDTATATSLGLADGIGVVGATAQSISEALSALNMETDFYFFALDEDFVDQTAATDAATWSEANTAMLALDHEEQDVADETLASDTGVSQTIAASLTARDLDRAFGVWHPSENNQAIEAAAVFTAVDFGQPNSIPALFAKRLPGRTPIALTDTQKDNLDDKNVNYLQRRRTVNVFLRGTTYSGKWIDEQFFVDWLDNELQVQLFNMVYQARPKIPYTDVGAALVRARMETVGRRGVDNGGLAPGQLEPAVAAEVRSVTGNADFSGYLPNGFLAWVPLVSSRTASTRSARLFDGAVLYAKGSRSNSGYCTDFPV